MAGAIQSGLPFLLEVIGTTQNSNPEITSTPVLNAVLGQAYSYQLDAFDADGDPVEYRLVEGPKGMTLNGLLGRIRWTPKADQLGP